VFSDPGEILSGEKLFMINIDNVERIRQGDVLKEIEYIESYKIDKGHIVISTVVFPYVVVLSQDCDLAQDYNKLLENNSIKDENNKKYNQNVLSIMVVPLYNKNQVFEGSHLQDLDQKLDPIPYLNQKHQLSTIAKGILDNNNPRYHFFEFSNEEEIDLPDCISDFKHFFTVNRDYLIKQKRTKYICSLDIPFREALSHRFAFYLSRIGLPAFGGSPQ